MHFFKHNFDFMEDLRKSKACFICGVVLPAADDNIAATSCPADSKLWKEQCAIVLSGLLCSGSSSCSGRSSSSSSSVSPPAPNTKDILVAAKYCSRCDVSIKDLCCSFQMMDNLRAHMAGIVKEVAQSIFKHYNQLELESQSLTSRSSRRRCSRGLRNALGNIFKVSELHNKSQEEVRGCIFYKLAEIEFPPSPKRKKLSKANLKKRRATRGRNAKKANLEVPKQKVNHQDEVEGNFHAEEEDDIKLLDDVIDELISKADEISSRNTTNCSDTTVGDFVVLIKDDLSDHCQDDDEPTSSPKMPRNDVEEKQDTKSDADFVPTEKNTEDYGSTSTCENAKSSQPKIPSISKRKQKEVSRALRSFVCTYAGCAHRFTNEVARDGHYQKIHLGNPRPFKCSVCDKAFPFSTYLNYHLFKVHGQDNEQGKSYKSYGCTLCSKTFPDSSRLELHMGSKHLNYRNGVSHSCKVCAKGFKTEEEVDEHKERIHTGETPFQCEDCGEVFSNSVNLRNHTHMKHPREGSVVCDVCQRVVLSEAHLMKHKTFNHPELFGKTIVCKFCKESFKSAAARYYHRQKVHPETLKRTEFPCETCGVKCKTHNALRLHRRKHTGEKPYDCQVCGKSFRAIYDLKNHELAHSGLKVMCHYCGKTFLKNATFRNHLKIEEAKAERNAAESNVTRKGKSKKSQETLLAMNATSDEGLIMKDL